MSSVTYPKRSPAVHCWIKHLVEGTFSDEDKFLYTIFGRIKRARILGTIVDKRELIASQPTESESAFDSDIDSELRIEFDLDDSTGLIRATLWQADPEKYENFHTGDIVDVVGIVRKWKDFINISPEIIKKVEDPNYILLRNAEIIKQIQSGDTMEIPEQVGSNSKNGDFPNEIDVNALFEDKDDLRDQIYTIIKASSNRGTGVKIDDLMKKIESSEGEIVKNIKLLEKESKIYVSEEKNGNFYHSY